MHNHLEPPEGSRTHLLISMFLLNVHTKQHITHNYNQNHRLSQKITTLLTSMLVQPLCDMLQQSLLLTHCVSGAC